MASNQIVPADLSDKLGQLCSGVEDIIGPGGMDASVLPRISLVHQGPAAFAVEIGEEEDDVIKGSVGFDAVALYVHPIRVYWATDIDESEGQPPDCSSFDAKTGSEFGVCKNCQFAQWGSADPDDEENNAQACQEKRRFFLLRGDSLLPYIFDAPVSSLKRIKKWGGVLLGKSISYWLCVTHFTCVKEKKAGKEWAELQPILGDMLPETDIKGINQFHDFCVAMALSVPIVQPQSGEGASDGDDFSEGDTKDTFND